MNKKEKTQIYVICSNCDKTIIKSKIMTKGEAEESLPQLNLTSVFNAPRCKECNNSEPYRDINVGHKLEIKVL